MLYRQRFMIMLWQWVMHNLKIKKMSNVTQWVWSNENMLCFKWGKRCTFDNRRLLVQISTCEKYPLRNDSYLNCSRPQSGSPLWITIFVIKKNWVTLNLIALSHSIGDIFLVCYHNYKTIEVASRAILIDARLNTNF